MKNSNNSLFDYTTILNASKISVLQITYNRSGKLRSLTAENFLILSKLVMVH